MQYLYASASAAKINAVERLDGNRVPHKRRVPDTGRRSRQFVLIEASGFYASIGSFTVFNSIVFGLNAMLFLTLFSSSVI